MSLRKDIEWRILDVWSVIDRFVRVTLLRDCERNCPLCAIDRVLVWHCNHCELCQNDGECKTVEILFDQQNNILDKEWPD